MSNIKIVKSPAESKDCLVGIAFVNLRLEHGQTFLCELAQDALQCARSDCCAGPSKQDSERYLAAKRTLLLAYPEVVVEPETRRLAAELLAREDLDPILRRIVRDADDDMRKALAAHF